MLQPQAASSTDIEVPYLRAGSLMNLDTATHAELPTMYASLREVQTYRLEPGDLVVAEGGDVGRTEFVPPLGSPLIFQNSLHRLRPREGDRRYFRYALQSVFFSGWLDVVVNRSTFGHLTSEKLKSLRIPFPVDSRQRAIADFLDRETARIDALIDKKQRMITLLDERASAMTRHATRRGLDGAALRSSPFAWITKVPSHWTVVAMRRVGQISAGAAFPEGEQGRTYEPIPYFKVRDFESPGNEEYLRYAANTVSVSTAERLHSPIVASDSIVFPKIGAALLSNRRRMLAVASCLDQNVMALTVDQGVPRFFYYLLQSFDWGRLRMPGPVPLLNEQDAASVAMPVPPPDEQARIVSYLDTHLVPLRALRAMNEKVWRRLQERRQAVITAAVTGQLEIPGAA